jgi:hypothetical protein
MTGSPLAGSRLILPSMPPTTTTSSERAQYTAPRLESLGAWQALTLQQSIPIGPGSLRMEPEDSTTWLA